MCVDWLAHKKFVSRIDCFCTKRVCLSAGPEGYYLHGWEKQFKFLSTKWEKVSQADRIAQVMWRGRTIDTEFPERDAMR